MPDIQINNCYSNGKYGRNWSVRRVVSIDQDEVHYKVVAGSGRRQNGVCSMKEFLGWMKYEVYLSENSWLRKDLP